MCWQGHDRHHWSERAGRWDRPPRHASDDRSSTTRADLRVSDADRHSVIEELRQHTGDGRLTLDEFEERVDEVLRARTRADLDTAMRELPHLQPQTAPRLPGSRLHFRPGVIAACLVVALVIAGHWWVLIPVGFFVISRSGRPAHHAPCHRREDRDDSIARI
jgi:hypothetical protein